MVVNDLIGGWVIGSADKPLSQYNYDKTLGDSLDTVVAEVIDDEYGELITRLLNEHEAQQ